MNATLPALEQIWSWLEEVVDPEIPVVSVVDLGIVRGLSWCKDQGEPKLTITITSTYSGCPATAVIKKDIVTALNERGITNIQIETRLAPAWTTDWLSEKGKRCLREYGIAPPQRLGLDSEETPTECPRCGSKNTRMVSQFGSTPCKAFYVCDACCEPFDHFKCH
jgi:ring-1,2-phenylacetyl-CoA epoxidase subunit PaaD